MCVCKCVQYYCHRVATQLQLTNISNHIFPYCFLKGAIKKYIYIYIYWTLNALLIFSTTFVWNIFHSKRNSARYSLKCVKHLPFFSDSTKIWIFPTDILNILEYQITWKSVLWQPSYSMRTDMTKLNSRFSQFSESAWKHEFTVFPHFYFDCCKIMRDSENITERV